MSVKQKLAEVGSQIVNCSQQVQLIFIYIGDQLVSWESLFLTLPDKRTGREAFDAGCRLDEITEVRLAHPVNTADKDHVQSTSHQKGLDNFIIFIIAEWSVKFKGNLPEMMLSQELILYFEVWRDILYKLE